MARAIDLRAGVAQRTGATLYYLETMPARSGETPVLALMPTPGDVTSSCVGTHGGRARHPTRLSHLTATTLITSTQRAYAVAEKGTPGEVWATPGRGRSGTAGRPPHHSLRHGHPRARGRNRDLGPAALRARGFWSPSLFARVLSCCGRVPWPKRRRLPQRLRSGIAPWPRMPARTELGTVPESWRPARYTWRPRPR